ncbi:MAG: BMP family ABC transporter substrate-binding protein [Anaerolineae bacterium]|nr:BMP family ABC transporter substrate-binding protein [Anaerolineae bacterium]MBN8618276.1 BMP family ABC transporter substrate-binding protein [Anaerolineae bacterium]
MSRLVRPALILVVLAALVGMFSVSLVSAQDASDYVDPCLAEGAEAGAEAEAVEVPDNSDISFQIILPGARGDRSFTDSAAAGAERAIAELGVDGTIIEPSGAQEHDAAIRRAVQEDPNLVITIAVDASVVEELVDEYSDQKFAAQETFFPAPPEYDNLALFNILTHENSYLAGIAAGMLTRTKVVGAVGGGDFPGINLFIVGYEEGVKSVCADCTVLRSYVGGAEPFNDPVRAKELSLGLFSQGADILYQVAGRSGEGVLEAAKETGNFAIGVDSNQDDLYPGTVIVSAMKRVDNAVFGFVESIVNDTYVPGTTNVGLAEGYAGLSWDVGICSRTFDENGPEDLVEKLPAVRQAIDEARAKILAGEIVVTNALFDSAS